MSPPLHAHRLRQVVMKVILPGGTGQLGTILARALHGAGHQVVILNRRPAAAPWRTVSWDERTVGTCAAELEGADAVINAACVTIHSS